MNIAFAFLLLALPINALALASPVLVSVDLPSIDSKKAWHALEIPTYRFLGNTAIAECPEELIPELYGRGFAATVVDRTPWDRGYCLVSPPPGRESLVAGSIILQGNGTSLVEATLDDLASMRMSGLKLMPVERRPLSDRFWRQATTKYVGPKSLPWNPYIQGLVDQVSTDSICSSILRLQDFKTRLALTDSSLAASQWILDKFDGWGFTTSFDSVYIDSSWFYVNWPDTGWERNVMAVLPGSLSPDIEYIIGGHFDSTTLPDTITCRTQAPGADDNASGVAATLEVARIMRSSTWKPTLRYATWAGEEIGCFGSEDYARRAEILGTNIGGLINLDMVGYMNDANVDGNVMHNSPFSEWLSQLFVQSAQTYAPALFLYQLNWGGSGSDDYRFDLHGFPAICGIERHWTNYPYYHTADDLLAYLSPALLAEFTKASLATLSVLGYYPGPVAGLACRDVGDGVRLVATWYPGIEMDVSGYVLKWGPVSGSYTDSAYVPGRLSSGDTIGGLLADSAYFITVVARDDSGRHSVYSTEVAGTPRVAPVMPCLGLTKPVSSGIEVLWRANTELDLDGYRLYRAVDDTSAYDSLNVPLLADTSYTDSPLSGAHRYYYKVRAFDLDWNYSPLSEQAYGRPATLDQGVLVVDETYNWTSGNLPRDTAQDQFYDYMLSGFQHDQYEYGSPSEMPLLCDLAPYSTVLWHADDYTSLMASGSLDDLGRYLDWGGNLWLVGWKPISNLQNGASYPAVFSDTSFIRNHLKITEANLSASADSFQAAGGSLGYPGISVDPAKVPLASWGGTMRYIESFVPADSGEVIYAMDMRNGSSPFQGLPCGVRYLGPSYNTVIFGFPLYFMDREMARAAAQQVMADFGETGIEGGPSATPGDRRLSLEPCSPNPFSRSTVIRYHLPKTGRTELSAYNVAGQRVVTLVDGWQEAGCHSVSWDNGRGLGYRLGTGVYLIRLKSGGDSRMVKAIRIN